MKLCLFSDIHGNAHAMGKALPLMLAEEADYYVFLGDLCGYYYNAELAYNYLTELPNLLAVLGNHDLVYLEALRTGAPEDEYTTKYGDAINVLLETKMSAMTHWLNGLKKELKIDEACFCCHEAPPRSIEKYIYPDTSLDMVGEYQGKHLFIGHTHYRMVRKTPKGLIVNPGSIGQPRDGLMSSFATIDLKNDHVHFHDVKWDRDALKKDLRERKMTKSYAYTIIDRIQEKRNA